MEINGNIKNSATSSKSLKSATIGAMVAIGAVADIGAMVAIGTVVTKCALVAIDADVAVAFFQKKS